MIGIKGKMVVYCSRGISYVDARNSTLLKDTVELIPHLVEFLVH